MNDTRKAFTLIELLVVIAIIAVLAVVVILVLNPAELLRQSRDANRLSDLATMNSAFNIFSEDVTGGSLGSSKTAYISISDPSATSTAGDQCQGLGLSAFSASTTYQCAASSSARAISGTGWIPVNLSLISSGSPFGSLPVDPINQTSSGLYYTYSTNAYQFEITALMESQKYQAQVASNPGIAVYPGIAVAGNNFTVSPLWNPSGLAGYWNLDEGTGTVIKDSSGNGDSGTLTNASGWVSGKVGPYAVTSKNTETLTLSVPSSLMPTSSLTISLWTNIPVHYSYAGYGNNDWTFADGAWDLYSNSSGNLSFGVDSTPGITQYVASGCSTQFTNSKWHLIVGTYDGTTVKAYLDGTLCGSTSLSGQSLYAGSGGSSTIIFNDPYNATGEELDDIRMYTRALSAAEIQALYNEGSE